MSRKSTTPSDRPAKEQSFEDSLAQLETIIGRIEGGKVGLEGAIAEYERGVVLLRRLRDTLRKSEQRVEELNAELAALEKPGDDGPDGDERRGGAEPGSW